MKCLDTCVLLYAADKSSPHHRRAVELIEQAERGEWVACVCQQSLWEMAAMFSNPHSVRRPLLPAQLAKMVDKLTKYPQPEILYSDDSILRKAIKLMEKYPALQTRFSKAHLAATMLAHGVKTLVTADSKGFSAIREIEVENPFETLFA